MVDSLPDGEDVRVRGFGGAELQPDTLSALDMVIERRGYSVGYTPKDNRVQVRVAAPQVSEQIRSKHVGIDVKNDSQCAITTSFVWDYFDAVGPELAPRDGLVADTGAG